MTRKMLRCEAHDDGRSGPTRPRSATKQVGIFRANPAGQGFPSGLLCRKASQGNGHWDFTLLRAQRRSVGRGTPQGIGQRRRTQARATVTLALLTARCTALLRWRHVARAILKSRCRSPVEFFNRRPDSGWRCQNSLSGFWKLFAHAHISMLWYFCQA